MVSFKLTKWTEDGRDFQRERELRVTSMYRDVKNTFSLTLKDGWVLFTIMINNLSSLRLRFTPPLSGVRWEVSSQLLSVP